MQSSRSRFSLIIGGFPESRRRDLPNFAGLTRHAYPLQSQSRASATPVMLFRRTRGSATLSHPSCSTRRSVVKAFADSVREVKRTPADVPLSAAATAAHTCARDSKLLFLGDALATCTRDLQRHVKYNTTGEICASERKISEQRKISA